MLAELLHIVLVHPRMRADLKVCGSGFIYKRVSGITRDNFSGISKGNDAHLFKFSKNPGTETLIPLVSESIWNSAPNIFLPFSFALT